MLQHVFEAVVLKLIAFTTNSYTLLTYDNRIFFFLIFPTIIILTAMITNIIIIMTMMMTIMLLSIIAYFVVIIGVAVEIPICYARVNIFNIVYFVFLFNYSPHTGIITTTTTTFVC